MFNRKKLADYMKEHSVTNMALAKRFGVSEGAIRHVVAGIKQPSFVMAIEIARMIGCSLDELVVEVE